MCITNEVSTIISKYKTIHILLTNVHLDCRGRVPVTGMQAVMNLSKPGMNLSKVVVVILFPAEYNNTIQYACLS